MFFSPHLGLRPSPPHHFVENGARLQQSGRAGFIVLAIELVTYQVMEPTWWSNADYITYNIL